MSRGRGEVPAEPMDGARGMGQGISQFQTACVSRLCVVDTELGLVTTEDFPNIF